MRAAPKSHSSNSFNTCIAEDYLQMTMNENGRSNLEMIVSGTAMEEREIDVYYPVDVKVESKFPIEKASYSASPSMYRREHLEEACVNIAKLGGV